MKIITVLAVALLLSSCTSAPAIYAPSLSPAPGIAPAPVYSAPTNKPTYSSGSYSRRYIRGPRGGCYYINSNGNKTYVDHGFCR